MQFTYKTVGICPGIFTFTVEDGILVGVDIVGGCDGNLKGISSLIRGMPVDEVISKLDGIMCGTKQSSCPDQIATALKKMKQL